MPNTNPQQELNRQAAEKIMKWEIYIKKRMRFGEIGFYNTGDNPKKHISVKGWNPAEENSGQIFLVLDRMAELGFKWRWEDSGAYFYIVYKNNLSIFVNAKNVLSRRLDNQTIIECCLEALEKRGDSDVQKTKNNR